MSDPSSFASRRPNASSLPSFELPPPQLSTLQTKFSAPLYSNLHSTQPTPTSSTLTSVGNLLTPPSNSSADGLSPASGLTANNPMPSQSYTPNSSNWTAPALTNVASTPYGFQSAAQTYARGNIFSPSLNTMIRANHSPNASESLPPPPYELPHHYGSSMSMSAPSLPAMPPVHHQQFSNGNMGGSAPQSAVTQASPVHSQDAFARPPPTPTYYNGSQPSSTPQQANFSYTTGPSQIQQSPVNGPGSMPRVSPASGHGQMPSLQSQSPAYAPQRSYAPTYQPMGPVLSNVGNPHGQLALVNGMTHGMPLPYNSGHAAMQQMYGHHPAPNLQNDRPFRCDQCPQSFNRNHDLKRHKRIHLAVKPFPCGHCDKSFSRKDALKVCLLSMHIW
jgi:hypothetical protein